MKGEGRRDALLIIPCGDDIMEEEAGFSKGGFGMLKLEIKIDESKVTSDGRYTLLGIYKTLDLAFKKYGFNKLVLDDGTLCYSGNGKAKDYGAFGRVITSLKDKDWFINNTSKWLWYNSDDGEDEDDFSVEDVLFHYTQRKSIA